VFFGERAQFLAILLALLSLRVQPSTDGRAPAGILQSLREGVAFVRARRGLMLLW
jgi:hypothetical protein